MALWEVTLIFCCQVSNHHRGKAVTVESACKAFYCSCTVKWFARKFDGSPFTSVVHPNLDINKFSLNPWQGRI